MPSIRTIIEYTSLAFDPISVLPDMQRRNVPECLIP